MVMNYKFYTSVVAAVLFANTVQAAPSLGKDYADFKNIKDFYPRLEFLSTMIDQNTNLSYETINSFPSWTDTALNFPKMKTNIGILLILNISLQK